MDEHPSFSRPGRHSPATRLASVTFRSLHLVGASGVAGGIMLGSGAPEATRWLWVLAVASGLVLLCLEIGSHGAVYFRMAASWLVGVKLLLAGVALHVASVATWAVVLCILLSGVVSHMPKAWRHRVLIGPHE